MMMDRSMELTCSSRGCGPADDGQRLARSARPRVAGEHAWRFGEHRGSGTLVEQQAVQRACDRRLVAERHVEGGFTADFARYWRVGQQHRDTSGERFERCQPEALVFRQKRKGSRRLICRAKRALIDVLPPADLTVEPLAGDGGIEILARMAAVV